MEGRSTTLKSLDGLWETPSFPQREVKRPKVKLIVPIYNRDKEWVEICFHSPILLRGVHGDNFASHLACVKIAVNKSSPLQPGCTQVPFYTGSWISGLQILMTVKSYRYRQVTFPPWFRLRNVLLRLFWQHYTYLRKKKPSIR